MFINNIEKIEKYAFSCNEELALYLMDKGIPLLGKKKSKFFFSKSDNLEKVLKNMKIQG